MSDDPGSDRERRLEEALAEYMRLAESGTPPDRDPFMKERPDLAPELANYFSNLDRLKRAVQPLRDSRSSGILPRRFGNFELMEEIGRGGMGVVYKARDLRLKKIVALKKIGSGALASECDVARLKFEAEAAAELDHPNIVPIYELGEEEGQPYFTMKYIEGANLDDQLEKFRNDPRAAARLLLTLANAVRYALQRGILHRDLKPGNVMIDGQGIPHIADFGLARRIEDHDSVTSTGEVLGTLAYMAPELVSGSGERPSTAVDVYGLGGILYALLTGRAPFEGKNVGETLEMVRQQDPTDPRALNPKVPRELAAICLKALEKNLSRRYDSPRTLADDLGAWLEGRPVLARPVGRLTRSWRWCRRNAALSMLIGSAAVLLLAGVTAILFRSAQRAGRREEILETNVYIARHVASIVLNRFQKWGADVERAASHPELGRRLETWNALAADPSSQRLDRPEAAWLQEFCEELQRGKDPAIQNWHILDLQGRMVGRTPAGPIRGSNFKERDYFRGTLGHAGKPGRVHVSSVFRSVADNLYKFDVCAPILDGTKVVGVIAASVTTDPTMGLPNMHDERRKAVLVAPWGKERRPNDPVGEGPPPEYVILLHPAYTRGEKAVAFDEKWLPSRYARRCDEELSAPTPQGPGTKRRGYLDSFGERNPDYLDLWLAGFAPVGNTGFVVLIQTHDD